MGKRGPQPKVKLIDRFKLIKELMKQGFAKAEACKQIGVHRSWVYDNLTPIQHKELDEIYYSLSNGSTGTKWKVENQTIAPKR